MQIGHEYMESVYKYISRDSSAYILHYQIRVFTPTYSIINLLVHIRTKISFIFFLSNIHNIFWALSPATDASNYLQPVTWGRDRPHCQQSMLWTKCPLQSWGPGIIQVTKLRVILIKPSSHSHLAMHRFLMHVPVTLPPLICMRDR